MVWISFGRRQPRGYGYGGYPSAAVGVAAYVTCCSWRRDAASPKRSAAAHSCCWPHRRWWA